MKLSTNILALVLSFTVTFNSNAQSNKEKAVALLESIETGDPTPVSYINPEKYIQHNLMVADGIEGFGAIMQNPPEGGFKAEVIRAFQDGDYVFTQTKYDFYGEKVGFDIFRFENGLIVEHWDNLAALSTEANSTGRTQLNGPTEVQNPELTEETRELITEFVVEGFVNGKMMKAMKILNGKNYAQHSVGVEDNMKGLMAVMKEAKKSGNAVTYTKNHMILVEGEYALSVSEGLVGETPTAFYDLFRVEDGKVVEHWDTIETILPESEWKNSNGKF